MSDDIQNPNAPQAAQAGPAPAGHGDRVPDAQPADPASDLPALLAKAEKEVADLRDAWLRAKAETDNVRRQSQADVARAHKYAVEKLVADLLPVKDALEQALKDGGSSPDQLRTGVELTLKQLASAFGRAQIVEIDPAAGEKFDPHRQQAMAMIEADAPANTVVQVFQKGYLLNDRVVRPAMVAVAKGKDA